MPNPLQSVILVRIKLDEPAPQHGFTVPGTQRGYRMQLRRPPARAVATLGALSLAIGFSSLVPDKAATAGTSEILRAALADPYSAASESLDPGIVAHLPAATRFVLSPELAAIYGAPTLDVAGAKALLAKRGTAAQAGVPMAETPAVGTVRKWPALDQAGDSGDPVLGLYLKEYTLLAKGSKIEVWVASGKDDKTTGTQFMAGDCRMKAYDPTQVTKAQADGLISEFEKKMLPVEDKEFSVAPAQDGTASLGQFEALGIDFRGNGESTVTLVDNVRDANFYDFVNNRSYIAGFFAPLFNALTNRNVMTIDAFDWAHRTGVAPKNEPSEDICKSRPARPRMYEGVFAHEYQHLLHSYQDQAETVWVNEGLSDMAPALVGYSDARRNVHQTRAESHIYCFQGYGNIKGPSNPNPNPCGGPENSLTLWKDEGDNSEILADYGNAWSFMLYLYDHYGTKFISELHTDGDAQGLPSVAAVLKRYDPSRDVMDLVNDYQLMTLLDHTASIAGMKVTGADLKDITSKSLDSSVNLKNKTAYDKPGGAPNGADYVELRSGDTILKGSALKSLTFSGAATLPTDENDPFAALSGGGPDIETWTVRLVGIDEKGKKVLVKTYKKAFDLKLDAADLAAFKAFPSVVAMVSQGDSRELIQTYAPYKLTVNGEVQPG